MSLSQGTILTHNL